MDFDLQPTYLENDLIKLHPLKKGDFTRLYQVASDPLLWEQHPNKDRYRKEVFEKFFSDAIESKGAFIVMDVKTKKPIGSSRFYEYNEQRKTIAIGYTFLARNYWGTTYNKALKTAMLNYAFQFIDTVFFYIGATNLRSQKAIEKLGAVKIEEKEIQHQTELKKLNYIYQLTKQSWNTLQIANKN